MASVDIVIPCYNYARYLKQAVDSALGQEGVSVRVTIIDDCSPDNTQEVGRALAAADSRVTYRRHEVNRGHIATYNEGLEEATADYVVLLSADDVLVPGSLRRAADLMDANPSVGMTYGSPISFYDDVLPPARTSSTGHTVWKGADWLRLACTAGRNFLSCPEAVMRTSVQHRLVGYKASLPHSADLELWLRAALVSDIGRVNGADQAYYRIHSQSMQRTTFSGVLPDLVGRRDAFTSALSEAPQMGDEATTLLRRAHRVIALDAVKAARRLQRMDTPPAETIKQCCEFAQTTLPEVVDTREWKALIRQIHSPGLVPRWLSGMVASSVEKVEHHLAWRRWWRTGVF